MSVFLPVNFPTPVTGPVGSTVSLSSLLSGAFGENAQFISGAWLAYYGAPALQEWNFQYWDMAAPAVSTWQLNGAAIPAATSTSFNQTFVASANFSNVTVQVGNCIMPNLYMTIEIDRGFGDFVYMEYNLSSVSMATPNMAPAGHAPTAAQLVDTAISMASQFPNTPNNNDCHYIDAIVAAATGAPFPSASQSLNPSENIESGFWRIAYRGVPDQNWEPLTRPGDIVRFDWADPSQPQHTTMILGQLQPGGSIEVYDNIDIRNGVNYIGVHMANYDVQSVPSSVTIYRLTTDDLYLIATTNNAETVLGTTFNDKILAAGGG